MDYWHPDSWQNKEIKQSPNYKNSDELKLVENKLKQQPPLVFAGEIENLKKKLAEVNLGKAFIMQGGDCAESFTEFTADNIRDNFKLILQMAVILSFMSGKSVIKIGRIAGQFAKPRSNKFETKDSLILPSYRGDIVNSIEFDKRARESQPSRMMAAYHQSVSTINLLRAMSKGGMASLNLVHKWNLDFVEQQIASKYKVITDKINQALSFIQACGLQDDTNLKQTDFYTSHEALLLNYESSLTRIDSLSGKYYDCSAHMLWLGDRTKQLEGAHIEFLRGIENPIGIKIGITTNIDDLVKVIKKINPFNESGKIILIPRLGVKKIHELLPKIISSIQKQKLDVIWSSDPMHGNTRKANNGYKTRDFQDILTELTSFFEIHKSIGTYAGGIHLEMTGANVTECIGGADNISENDLSERYHTHCDPRLNAKQALEISFLISEFLK